MSDMSPIGAPRGVAAVGRIAELDPVEAGAVLYMRLCWAAPDALDRMTDDFILLLGSDAGQQAARGFHQLVQLCNGHARRPLCPHALNCACLGGDEACFARMVASAAEGAREDALMMALLLVRADIAPIVTGLAQDAGLSLRRMALRGLNDAAIPCAIAQGQRLH